MTLCGRINKLFGTGGGLRLTLYESFPEGFDPDTTPLIVEIDGLEVPLYCEKFEYVGASGASVTFADMDTDLLMIATIQSAQGVTDLLKQIFAESILP